MKKWPELPLPPSPGDCWLGTPLPPEKVRCKHGKGSCETCGTTNRRDSVHTTEGGLGAVGKLRERERKKRRKP